ncbi:DUF1450 domain-containing protein [Laceyella putida]|uniref:DUF1450 domain-containing protein n=1 Tax=Laceyella putida TaxID=110101 RepID=A0ABW2RFG6_9BACL
MVTVEFCMANLISGSLSAYYRLKGHQHPNIKVRAESCLGYCGRCTQSFFAFVNNELVEAKTPEDLYEKIVICVSDHLT